MGKRKRKGKTPVSLPKPLLKVLLEYHQIPFALFHKELRAQGYDSSAHHDVARSFWSVVPPGVYDPFEAKPILEKYLHVLEREISAPLTRHSIAYWLHSYRRLFPGGTGDNPAPHTIAIVRGTVEAAIQKYGTLELCSGVGFTHEIDTGSVFSGLLMHPKLETLRNNLQLHNQLVLTKFDVNALRELYEIEKLAYEVWRTSAALRIVAKGAALVVDPFHPGGFYDSRSDELDELVRRYDVRHGGFGASATGTTFDPVGDSRGTLFIGRYNVNSVKISDLQPFLHSFGLELENDFPTNFVWAPFNFGRYCKAHLPFADAFAVKHGTRLEWIFACVGALLWRVFILWREDPHTLFRHLQRSYEGPYLRSYIEQEIEGFLEAAIDWLDLPLRAKAVGIPATLGFLELTSEKQVDINLRTRGPMSPLLPCTSNRLFIDYCWIFEMLYNLFFEVTPEDQNFKGDALEEIVRQGGSVLPIGPCRALNGEEKQVDAAFDLNPALVIVECRAFARSFGVDLGDSRAIEYRNEKVLAALNEVDSKARWLASSPSGSNYDISRFKMILPVVVTPFVEYLPSLSSFYWLNEEFPRVMTPDELSEAMGRDSLLHTISAVHPSSVPVR